LHRCAKHWRTRNFFKAFFAHPDGVVQRWNSGLSLPRLRVRIPSSSLVLFCVFFGRIAQSVEHLAFNQGAVGSTPAAFTISGAKRMVTQSDCKSDASRLCRFDPCRSHKQTTNARTSRSRLIGKTRGLEPCKCSFESNLPHE
jgi:hypothetical protein